MSRKILLIALSAALLPALATAAEDTTVYRTTNADGTNSYSQVETRGAEVRTIDGSGPEQSLTEAPPAASADSQFCARAKSNLQLLSSSQALQHDTDGDGTPEPMSPEERTKQRQLAESQVGAYCASGSDTPAGETTENVPASAES